MTKYKKSGFGTSFQNAYRGLKVVLKSEKNFRFHSLTAFLVFLLAVLLGFDAKDLAIIVLTIAFVLICEMVNSAIEFTLDAVYKNKYSKLVGMAKDISAGAVMLSACTSVVIGILLFVHHFFD